MTISYNSMQPILLASLLGLSPLACMKGPSFFKQEDARRNVRSTEQAIVVVPTREEGSAVIGAIDPNATSSQLIQAPTDGDIAGSEVSFPPGSIAIATEITMQQGATLAETTTLAALDINGALTAQGAAVEITSSVSMDTAQPFTVALSVPEAASLVDDPLANLVVIYKVSKVAAAGDYFGVYTRDFLQIEGGKVKFSTTHFGTFQAVITETLVSAATEKPAEQVLPQPPLLRRGYYARGFQSVSFGDDASRQEGIQAWIAPGQRVSQGDSVLSSGIISYESSEDTP